MPKPYIPNDNWSKKAAKEGYRARSVYKLQELDERYNLLEPGITILDIGAAPGSWAQFAAQQIGPKGKLIGFDLQPIEPFPGPVEFLQADILDIDGIAKLLQDRSITMVDLVLSDLAPSTSGVRDVDQWKSIELNQATSAIAQRFLKPGGRCVLKVLRGSDFDEFLHELKTTWADVRMARPSATRDRSTEVYMILTKFGGKRRH